MPSHAPEEITDERERELWRDLSRVYEDYCGSNPGDYIARTISFRRVLSAMRNRLREAATVVVETTRQSAGESNDR